MTALIVVFIAFISALVQTSIGFGAGLVAMPLLAYSIGIGLASPTFAVIAILSGCNLAYRYRHDFRFTDMARLLLGALLAIPLGVFLATAIEESIVVMLLGIITISYALYNLLNLRMPTLKNKNWGLVFGFFSGMLQGAYNTGGPPMVIYGNSQNWEPLRFKGNLQITFLPMSLLVTLTHTLNGHFVQDVWLYIALMIPGVILGQLVGFFLEPRINPRLFRQMVLVGLLILGITLVTS